MNTRAPGPPRLSSPCPEEQEAKLVYPSLPRMELWARGAGTAGLPGRSAMAQVVLSLSESLQDEATCPICLEFFRDPVITDCSHNFCRECFTQHCRESAGNISCPQCRKKIQQKNLRPNRQLANMVEIAMKLSLEAARRAREIVCEKHKEPLKLFCESDQSPICLVCRESEEHRAHAAVPIEEAAQHYKEKLQNSLRFLQQERKEFNPKGDEKSNEMLRQVESERQDVLSEFEQLHQFLSEQQCLLLSQLEVIENEVLKRQNEYVTRVSEKKSLLAMLVTEVEKKCGQPATEFLQDVGSTLSRCEGAKAPTPEPVPPELEKKVVGFSENRILVTGLLATFKENLRAAMDKERANVTLDPDTAYPFLALSEDGKSMRLGQKQSDIPDNPKRFTSSPSVLGTEGFAAGRHYWEVEVGDGNSWAVGVATESVKRKGQQDLITGGVWALRRGWNDQYTALTFPPTLVLLEEKPRMIRVHLDYEEGQVTFYNAENMVQIYQFTATFHEKIFPYFWLWSPNSQLRLRP
ncbi:E3 ubiquitin-protein ligase TRIM39 [Alligator mississippiensis]|uniref:E3 ubiquitin-protein ligase TRIM39-like n=1 Tax=Alligator mississippiensis TaxID=8496 RepID=A0A151N901_ALLMI|nr:E3 ubiquitin-protein ligase TRIM39 [Alligator mississippiensis]KYO33308.1 E3 ubiquitin-protein ligase TRIM39-like [Alligator mississippiensis]